MPESSTTTISEIVESLEDKFSVFVDSLFGDRLASEEHCPRTRDYQLKLAVYELEIQSRTK